MVWGVLTCRNQGVMLSNFRDYAHWTIICKRNVNIDHWRRKTKVLKLYYFNNLEFFSKMPCSYDQGIEDFCAECKICTDRQTDRQASLFFLISHLQYHSGSAALMSCGYDHWAADLIYFLIISFFSISDGIMTSLRDFNRIRLSV